MLEEDGHLWEYLSAGLCPGLEKLKENPPGTETDMEKADPNLIHCLVKSWQMLNIGTFPDKNDIFV